MAQSESSSAGPRSRPRGAGRRRASPRRPGPHQKRAGRAEIDCLQTLPARGHRPRPRRSAGQGTLCLLRHLAYYLTQSPSGGPIAAQDGLSDPGTTRSPPGAKERQRAASGRSDFCELAKGRPSGQARFFGGKIRGGSPATGPCGSQVSQARGGHLTGGGHAPSPGSFPKGVPCRVPRERSPVETQFVFPRGPYPAEGSQRWHGDNRASLPWLLTLGPRGSPPGAPLSHDLTGGHRTGCQFAPEALG